MVKKLTIKQERFAQEYVLQGNASAAYRVAYDASRMTDEAVNVSACRLKAKVKLRIVELQSAEAEKYNMTRADVLKLWYQIATADPNDLMQVRRESCPQCYAEERRPLPRPDCSECYGEGEASIYITDTRKLTGAARLLYAGARKTKEGVEIIMRDQDAALINIAKFLGMFKESTEPVKSSTPIPQTLPTDPVEAARVYQQIMLAK